MIKNDKSCVQQDKPEFTIVVFVHYKLQIAVTILEL